MQGWRGPERAEAAMETPERPPIITSCTGWPGAGTGGGASSGRTPWGLAAQSPLGRPDVATRCWANHRCAGAGFREVRAPGARRGALLFCPLVLVPQVWLGGARGGPLCLAGWIALVAREAVNLEIYLFI